VALVIFLSVDRSIGTFRTIEDHEAAARVRLQAAEQRLSHDLGGGYEIIQTPVEAKPAALDEKSPENVLALSALWEVTHSRIDLYHQIATGQARRSFLSAQLAAIIGFTLIILFAVLATRTHNEAGAITVGSLGAVSAALAGYIGRTFVRSQESAASHLTLTLTSPWNSRNT